MKDGVQDLRFEMGLKRAPIIGLTFLILIDLMYWLSSGVDAVNAFMFYLVWWPVAWLTPLIRNHPGESDTRGLVLGIALFVAGQAIDLVIFTFIANYFLKRRMRRDQTEAS